jgi:hypothetical protein
MISQINNELFKKNEWVKIKSEKNGHGFGIDEKVKIKKINSHGFFCENEKGDVWGVTEVEIEKIDE